MKRILYFALLIAGNACAQTYDTNNIVVQTFAGSGFSGWVDGVGTQTMFNGPQSVIADSQGNLFLLDTGNSCVRKITSDGTVSTFAGRGNGGLPGYGTNVSLPYFSSGSMAIDHSNTLWIAAYACCPPFLLRIGSDAHVTQMEPASLGLFKGICVDSANNVYVADSGSGTGNRIYRYRTNGIWEVFAGSGNSGSADGNGIFTSFYYPTTLAVDSADNIYVWDSLNYIIRRINPNRDVVTIAGKKGISSQSDGVGTNASFNSISGMCMDDSGNVILACGSSIRKMTSSTNVITMAGSFTQTGYTDGTGSLARFRNAAGVCVSQGMLFVADSNDHRIRNLTFNPAPQPVSGANLDLSIYPGLRITGVVGRSYRIESSLDMTNWNTETTILLTSSPYLWIDPNSLRQKQFYRAFLLP
jgi:hypothetical protein